MRLFLSAIALAVATATLLVGCNTGNGVVTVASTKSNVRIVNLIPNAGAPLVVTLDDEPFASGVAFQSLSTYQSIKAGVHTFRAFVTGAPTNVIATGVATLGEANYSYLMYGPITAPVARIYDDTFSDPGANNFNVRVINAAAGIGLVDVYLTAAGADLNRVAPSVSGVEYAAVVSPFTTLPVGNLQLRVTPAGSKEVIYDSPPFNYQERAAYDIVVYTRGSANLVNVALLSIDGAGTGTIIDSLLSQFKVVNASTVASPLNVFFDGVLRLSNIPIAGATGYQRTTAGQHTLRVEATATPGATLLTYSPILLPAMDASIILEGPAGSLQAVLLPDNNLPPGPGNARVRVVNATADVAAIDVFVNFSKQISALPQNSGAYSLELTADAVTGTAFQFSFNVAGSAQTLLTLPAVTLVATKTYTLYIVGPATALKAGLTQDN
ncbi:MAG: DUF4397 domain-containing protein [Betaproteobacteria bacterium]